MNKLEQWDGKLENTNIEYDLCELNEESGKTSASSTLNTEIFVKYDEPDKTDYIVAACCGVVTGVFDSFWVGEFSLLKAQEWGRTKANSFVIKVAQLRGYTKNELDGAIRFLEKDAPMASDRMTNVWGGALQHHFRDFGHHASVAGLVFSVLTQFTGLSFGTNTDGKFEIHEISEKSLIGGSFEEKLYKGIVLWVLHLISDMAGSSNSAGKGTGIPGPILSLVKELSVLPGIRNIHINFKEDDINLSEMLSKIFNGTAFEHTNNKDLKRFDLRTELGVYAYGVKQSIPVVMNQCAIRAFYFVRRLCMEINNKKIQRISEIRLLDSKYFMPWNNKCILRMATISSGVFCVIDTSDATIRAFLSGADNKGEFVTKLLLRTNFAGIGNFVVSIKNDLSANVFGNNQYQLASSTVEENVSVLDNIIIDVSVEVDSAGIYEYAFYRMYEHVKSTKERFGAALDVNRGMQTEILQLEDDETELFSIVANASYHALIVETEALMMRLLTFYGIGYIPFEGDEKYRFYSPFYRIEEGKKIAYLFSKTITSSKDFDKIQKECCVDGIKVIAMVELGEDVETRNCILNAEARKTGCSVEYGTLQDVFALISDKEYSTYKQYVEKYNADIKKLIGYRTIVVPSESSLQVLKDSLEKELRSDVFGSYLRTDGILDGQIKIINKNFWSREMYKALFGKASFAERFISSEWYYQTHKASSALEQTAIVAGYLKSVEQLLFALVGFSADSGKSIRKRGTGKTEYIEFRKDNLDAIDTTLGSIIGYARHYSDLWDVNNYVKNYIVDKLDVYRDKYRNDHFHKDNINSVEEIEAIRTNTILIHYLLLGAMKIKDSQKVYLSIEEKEIINVNDKGLEYCDVEKWLNRILGGDVLLSPDSNIYFEVGIYGEQWQIKFSTVSGFSEKGIPQDPTWPYICDELKWNRLNQDKYEAEKQAIDMVKRYLNDGKYAVNLKTYKTIYVGWFGNPILLYER